MKALVFVYGTLKIGYWNNRLLAASRFLGSDWIAGSLHDLSSFPAVCLTGDGEVQGEVYEVDELTLARLDRLEGTPTMYQRTRVRMSRTGREAWVYVMGASKLANREKIESGRWEGRT